MNNTTPRKALKRKQILHATATNSASSYEKASSSAKNAKIHR
jgi:hypothetical protein